MLRRTALAFTVALMLVPFAPTALSADANVKPVIDPIANRAVVVNQTLLFYVHAVDPNGDIVAYGSVGLPSGASFSSKSGEFVWKPRADQVGTRTITFGATDGRLTAAAQVTITVTSLTPIANRAPIMTVTAPETVIAGEEIAFAVHATDPEGSPVFFGLSPVPRGAELSARSGLFAWTTTNEEIGTHRLTFGATDGNAITAKTITITVAPRPLENAVPIFVETPPTKAIAGERIAFTVIATDANADPITYGVSPLPAGAYLDHRTGDFTWQTSDSDVGAHQLAFGAADGASTTRMTVQVDIAAAPVNRAPEFVATPPQSVIAGERLAFTIRATDADGDGVTYDMGPLPAGANLSSQSGEFSWQTIPAQVGTHQLNFGATDGAATTGMPVTITVTPAPVKNRAPSFDATPNQDSAVNQRLTFGVLATDPDGDSVTYDAIGLPAGAQFNRETGAFSWTPAAAGVSMIKFVATDGKLTAATEVSISVARAAVSGISPRTFGAIPNDGRDDTAALQAALNSAKPGERVLLEPGTYNVAPVLQRYALEIKYNGITLEGPAESTLRATSAGIGLLLVSADNVTIKGFHLDGGRVVVATLRLASISDAKVIEMDIEGAVQGTPAFNPRSLPTSAGIVVDEDSHRILITDNHIHAIRGEVTGVARGVYLGSENAPRPTTGVIIRGNLFDDILSGPLVNWDADGIHVQGGTQKMDVVIEDNVFRNIQKRAIKIQSPGVTARMNVIEGPSDPARYMYAAISIYGNDSLVEDNLVRGGYFTHGIEIGVYPKEIARVVVQNNTILATPGTIATTRSGISTPGIIESSRITGNEVSGFQYGIRVMYGAKNVIVDSNQIKNMSSRGIILTETAGVYSGITVTRNTFTLAGTYVFDAQVAGKLLKVSDNTGTANPGGSLMSIATRARIAQSLL